MEETIKNIKALIGIAGAAMTLGDAVTWLEVEENAERLLAAGHTEDASEDAS